MKLLVNCLIILMPILASSQSNTGIQFEQQLTWNQVKEKARKESKFIFVDCYATWCKPCKEMDQKVYPDASVGNMMNKKFISVKVQMDSTKNDNESVRLLYAAARQFENEYKITGLPTFLFFSPNGQLVHKGIGGQSIEEFTALAIDAIDPGKQLYALVNRWKSKQMPYSGYPDLIKKLRATGEDSLSQMIATEYMHDFLDKLSDDAFSTKENLSFFSQYLRLASSKDRIFKLYYNEATRVDKIMGAAGYAKDRASYIISKEEIAPLIEKANNENQIPDWDKIEKKLGKKYNKNFAFAAVIKAKIDWYSAKKDWENFFGSVMTKWNKDSIEFKKVGWMRLNDFAWKACVYSNDKKLLTAALKWIDIGLMKDSLPNEAMLDTKACVLYKLKRKEEAIACETKVVEILKSKADVSEHDADKKWYLHIVESYLKRIEQMKNDEPLVLVD